MNQIAAAAIVARLRGVVIGIVHAHAVASGVIRGIQQCLIHLVAIPINIDSVLSDRYQLVELGSTRQVVIPTQVKPVANDALM